MRQSLRRHCFTGLTPWMTWLSSWLNVAFKKIVSKKKLGGVRAARRCTQNPMSRYRVCTKYPFRDSKQCDQIGRFFNIWATFVCHCCLFFCQRWVILKYAGRPLFVKFEWLQWPNIWTNFEPLRRRFVKQLVTLIHARLFRSWVPFCAHCS